MLSFPRKKRKISLRQLNDDENGLEETSSRSKNSYGSVSKITDSAFIDDKMLAR